MLRTQRTYSAFDGGGEDELAVLYRLHKFSLSP